jgi:integrase/recombinase XerD
MKNPTDFAKLVSGFLNSYLPNEKGASINTIKSYSYTFLLFIGYMRDVRKTGVNRLTIAHLNKDLVVEFLEWLQSTRNCGDATRNQRLAAISSFIKYIEYMTPASLYDCHQILSIPAKKKQLKVMGYLSVDGMKLLLEQPDMNKTKELRDLAMLSLMYESAARVQEIIDLSPSSLHISNKPYKVMLHGKGSKYRSVPLPPEQVQILKAYLDESMLSKRENAEKPLFPNSQGLRLTRNGVNNILMKYVKMAREVDAGLLPEHLSCHSIRHSKAMALLEANVQLIHIRDFLGHKSVLTTEIYARVNPKYTFEAVKNAYKNITTDEVPVWENSNELMSMLKNLSK